MQVTFKNPKTGELKQVKVGWSWTLFCFAFVFGIPLFMRRLYVWGGVIVALCILNVFAPLVAALPSLILWILLAVKGNEMTAKNYLEHGWTFAEPDSDAVRFAKGKWGLALDSGLPAKA